MKIFTCYVMDTADGAKRGNTMEIPSGIDPEKLIQKVQKYVKMQTKGKV